MTENCWKIAIASVGVIVGVVARWDDDDDDVIVNVDDDDDEDAILAPMMRRKICRKMSS